MGQSDLRRTQFVARSTVTTPVSNARQEVDFLGYFAVGDAVRVLDVDTDGNILSVIDDTKTVSAIDEAGLAIILSGSVDTTGATGTPVIEVQAIDDGQEAVDRLYHKKSKGADTDYYQEELIVAQALNQPTAGKTTYYVSDVSFFKAGDTCKILADEGVVAASVTVDSVDPNADAQYNKATIVITTVVDTSAYTNPKLVLEGVSVNEAIDRVQEYVDEIDLPVENEYDGVGNKNYTCWALNTLFREGSSKVFLDGVRKRLGTAGTRASLTQGAGNAQLIATSMILGTAGNSSKLAVTSATGTAVVVSGNFNSGYTVSAASEGGTLTSEDIATNINAHSIAKRILQVRYGGDGTGVVSPFSATALSGGLNNGTGDYAELEQVLNNQISDTGFKFVSFWILPTDPNRMNVPPTDQEEICTDYRQFLVNSDR